MAQPNVDQEQGQLQQRTPVRETRNTETAAGQGQTQNAQQGHAPPVEGAKDADSDADVDTREADAHAAHGAEEDDIVTMEEASDDQTPEEGKDYWRAGQEADPNAGDEGVDDGMEAATPEELNEGVERQAKQQQGVTEDDVDLPEQARRLDIDDQTR